MTLSHIGIPESFYPNPQFPTTMPLVHGQTVDKHTRCTHYHLDLDVIAIKFSCCSLYYPCYKCHQEDQSHEVSPWNPNCFDTEKVILCGMCQSEWTFNQYKKQPWCLNCLAKFNPGCANHYHIYFDTKCTTKSLLDSKD
ncbi:hypothetical protein PUMCH_001720 [Australozyma saopauloensis]|uniref:CHY-type domain-containing protein n=1 Tax=Australozyma saopauloensis TaxID=291208 RepID=A0AAX4H787_9ASCO|nr:hypothetical protein PUMCH_001720 [[Candida] saopauloensis]